MSNIQFDMFEVQLGSALLLQMRDSSNTPVRVLADAGIRAAGYKKDHVNKKLVPAFDDFDRGSRHRIDLMVGTHYDEDHLKGLIAVASNKAIEIGDALLPPLHQPPLTTADIDAVMQGQPARSAEAFGEGPSYYDDWHQEKLRPYLEVQLAICEACRQRIDQLTATELPPRPSGFLRLEEGPDGYGWLAGYLDERARFPIPVPQPNFRPESAEEPPDLPPELGEMFAQLQRHLAQANMYFSPECREDGGAMFFCHWDMADTPSRLSGGPSYLAGPASQQLRLCAIAQLAYIQKKHCKKGNRRYLAGQGGCCVKSEDTTGTD
jgi:hypothetical protein